MKSFVEAEVQLQPVFDLGTRRKWVAAFYPATLPVSKEPPVHNKWTRHIQQETLNH